MRRLSGPALISILLISSLSGFLCLNQNTAVLQDESIDAYISEQTATTFSNGAGQMVGSAGVAMTASLPLQPGYRLESGLMNLSMEGMKTTSSQSFSITSGTLNGTMNETMTNGTAVQLMSSTSGPPSAGTNTSMLFSTVTWSGTHNYSTLELRCGIQSCGKIVASGDLTLNVNTLIVEQGSSIESNDLVSGGTGAGTSTTTSTSGRNDGGGGAGHGGAGGSGGGTNGGAGGSSYGNASERGSQGGGVSSSYHSAVSGGMGGGYVRIFANSIIVNGSIHADGGTGDSGSQASSGTGAGGSGGGGGSGGSIYIKTNSLSVGSNGIIAADGGDGGDGANGNQNGPGFGMYDGGDGGGGGAGGRILVNTQSGGLSNSGTIQASGGSGGSKGLKYGTGVDGVDGNSGSNGVVTFQNWQGYMSQSNSTSDDGTFLTDPILVQSGDLSEVVVTHQSVVPVNSSLNVTYRWTMNGTNSSFEQWSDWDSTNLSQSTYPRAKWIQFSYHFNRTGIQSPGLFGVTIETLAWTTFQSPELTYSSMSTSFHQPTLELGFSSNISHNSSSQIHAVSLELPANATLVEDVRLWLQWDDSTGSITMNQIEIEQTPVFTTVLTHRNEGHDIHLDHQLLNGQFFNDIWTDVHGFEWRTLLIEFEMSSATNITAANLWMPYSYSTDVDVTDAYNMMVVNACGSVYLSTEATCLGQANAHPLIVDGQTFPQNAPSYTIELSELRMEFVDDLAPQVQLIEHRKGVEINPTLRVGDTFSVLLYDGASEDDLTVEYLGLDWDESQGFNAAESMTFTSILQGYFLNIDTELLDGTNSHILNMTFRLLDVHGNELLPRPTYQVMIYPSTPEVTNLEVHGHTIITGDEHNGTWNIQNAYFSFEVESHANRSDLDVRLQLDSSPHNQLELEMIWNSTTNRYWQQWMPDREDIGVWNIEVLLTESSGLMESDSNGFKDGIDASIHLIDAGDPSLSSVQYQHQVERNTSQFVNITWIGHDDEFVSGFISLFQDDIEVMNKTILPTLSKQASVLFDLTGLDYGQIEIHIFLLDDEGNVNQTSSGMYQFLIMPPYVEGDVSLSIENETKVLVNGSLQWRSGSGSVIIQNEYLDILHTHSYSNETFSFQLDPGLLQQAMNNFTVTACDSVDVSQCLYVDVQLDFSSAFRIDVDVMCEQYSLNTSSTDEQLLQSCNIINNGPMYASVEFVYDLTQLQSTMTLIGPGQTSTIELKLNNGTESINRTIVWSISAYNDEHRENNLVAEPLFILREISVDEPSEDTAPSSTSSSDAPTQTLLIVVLVIVIGGVIVAMLYFKGNSDLDGNDAMIEYRESSNLFSENQDMEHSVEEAAQVQESVQQATGHQTPNIYTQPTSIDEHGYEWYSVDGQHWYRTHGSNEEWTPYQ